jgi:hypothetical protein
MLARCLFAAALLAPHLAVAAACHDEADRLADRHAIGGADKPAEASPTRLQAQELLSAAREADDNGIVEDCLRQLAQARDLIESGAARPTRGAPRR